MLWANSTVLISYFIICDKWFFLGTHGSGWSFFGPESLGVSLSLASVFPVIRNCTFGKARQLHQTYIFPASHYQPLELTELWLRWAEISFQDPHCGCRGSIEGQLMSLEMWHLISVRKFIGNPPFRNILFLYACRHGKGKNASNRGHPGWNKEGTVGEKDCSRY